MDNMIVSCNNDDGGDAKWITSSYCVYMCNML
jgi:hypothetical protein